MRTIVIFFILSLLIFPAKSWAMIFSLGGGSWSPQDTSVKINNHSALSDFSEGKFARLSHEGVMRGNFLYVVSAGLNLAQTSASYEYQGENSKSSVSKLKSNISLVEARVGFKYNLGSKLYLGAGGVLGDFQINYDRDDYVARGGDTVNYQASENINYAGSYYEAGLMLLAKNWGVRLGAEVQTLAMQKNVTTLSETRPILNSSKVYMEILWKN